MNTSTKLMKANSIKVQNTLIVAFILFSSFFPSSYLLYQSLLDHERETHRDKAENDEDVHCRCISDLQQKVWKTIATEKHDTARLCFQFNKGDKISNR